MDAGSKRKKVARRWSDAIAQLRRRKAGAFSPEKKPTPHPPLACAAGQLHCGKENQVCKPGARTKLPTTPCLGPLFPWRAGDSAPPTISSSRQPLPSSRSDHSITTTPPCPPTKTVAVIFSIRSLVPLHLCFGLILAIPVEHPLRHSACR
jgi:hypothetical protein